MNLRPGQPMPCEGNRKVTVQGANGTLTYIVSIIARASQPHAIQPYTKKQKKSTQLATIHYNIKLKITKDLSSL